MMSLLSGWYFITRLQRPQKEQEVFLAILDGLSSHSNPDLAKQSFHQAVKLDLPLRIYLLPLALHTLRNMACDDAFRLTLIENYCVDFFEYSSECPNWGDEVQALLQLAVGADPSGSWVIGNIAERALLQQPSEVESRPYDSIAAHRTVSILLIVLKLVAERDGVALDDLLQSSDGDGAVSPKKALVEKALAGNHGRQARLVALELVAYAEATANAISSLSDSVRRLGDSGICRFEPDVVHSLVQTVFPLPPSPTYHDTKTLIRNIEDELNTFTYFQSVRLATAERTQWLDALNFMRLPPDDSNLLMSAVWRAALLQRLALAAPEQTRYCLNSAFLPGARLDLWYVVSGNSQSRYPQWANLTRAFILVAHLEAIIPFAAAEAAAVANRPAERPLHLGLLLHAGDAVRVILKSAGKKKDGPLASLLKEPMGILLSACQERLKAVAVCGLAPEFGLDFNRLLLTAQMPRQEYADKIRGASGDILLFWCQALIREGMALAQGIETIKTTIAKTCSWLNSRTENPTTPEFSLRLLLQRQFWDEPPTDPEIRSIREAVRGQNRPNSRLSMLAVRDFEARDWNDVDAYPARLLERAGKLTEHFQLTLALRTYRFMALCREEDPAPNLVQLWGSELRTAVGTLATHILADRFLCLAWGDLLGEKLTVRVDGLWNTLWGAILEFGGVTELALLRDHIAADWHKRLMHSGRLNSLIRMSMGALRSIQASESEARAPRDAVGRALRRQLLEDLLLLAILRSDDNGEVARWYREAFTQELLSDTTARTTTVRSAVDAMRWANQEDWVMHGQSVEGLSGWQVTGGVWNKLESSVVLQVNVPSHRNFLDPNGSTEDRDAVKRLLRDRTGHQMVAAPVIQAQRIDDRNMPADQTWLNVTFQIGDTRLPILAKFGGKRPVFRPCKFFSVNSRRRRLDSRRVVTPPDLCISYQSSSPHRPLRAMLKPSASMTRRLGR